MDNGTERQNDPATRQPNGAELTHEVRQTFLRDLLVKRNRIGAETNEGHLLSNLIEQSQWLSDPDPRPWASHPMQTVAGMMQWQMERLARSA